MTEARLCAAWSFAYNRGMGGPDQALEGMLKDLLQGILPRDASGQLTPEALAYWMAKEIRNNQRVGRGQSYAPDQLTLSMHSADVKALLEKEPGLAGLLSAGLAEVLRCAGYRIVRDVHVTLAADPTLEPGEAKVISWFSSNPLDVSRPLHGLPPLPQSTAPKAFLLVEGRRHFPLQKEVTHIGRRLDNDLVLEDSHVSRRHARIALEGDRFVLEDLNSTAGTRVNGQKITRHVLRPGDVIALAGVELIYGEDPGGPPKAAPPYTPPFKPGSDDERITPLFSRNTRNL